MSKLKLGNEITFNDVRASIKKALVKTDKLQKELEIINNEIFNAGFELELALQNSKPIKKTKKEVTMNKGIELISFISETDTL